MNRQQITEQVRLVLIEHLRCSPARITDRAEFRKDLGADSLDMVELPAAFEDAFGIRITEAEAEFCETVGTAIDLIEGKLENKRRAA
jgi:acyl carrier protein